MTPSKLKVGKVSEPAGYMIEWRPRKSAKWRAWVSRIIGTEKAMIAILKAQRSMRPDYTFRAVQIVKTPMEEVE